MDEMERLAESIVSCGDEDVKELVRISKQGRLDTMLEVVVPRLQRILRTLGGRVLSMLVQARIDAEGLGRRTVGAHKYCTRRWETVVGELELTRGYRRNADGEFETPSDIRLGLPRGKYGVGLQWLILLLSTQQAFAAAMETLGKLLGMEVSARTAQRLAFEYGERAVEAEGKEQEAVFERGEKVATEGGVAQRMIVSMDGGNYRSREREKEPWKEMKIACVARLDENGKVRGPRRYVSDADKDELGRLLYIEALRLGLTDETDLCAVADGAPMNWNQFALHFPMRREETLDFYHAGEHVSQCANALFGEGTKKARRWRKTQRSRLYRGKVNQVLQQLRRERARLRDKSKRSELLRRNVDYFEANRDRMDYPRLRSEGYPTGSGFVESGVKQVVTARLKGSGMRWRYRGAVHMAKLRALALSGRLHRFVMDHAVPHAPAPANAA